MQLSSARSAGRRWLRWGRVLLFGVLLGLLQMLLLTQGAGLAQWSASWLPAIALGALLYGLIPALEGFLTSRWKGDASSGQRAGCLVGGIGFLVIALTEAGKLALTPPPACKSFCQDLSGPLYVVSVAVAAYGGAVGGRLGGWIGGILGHKWATRSRRDSESTE
jgi:hypothetical protein